MEVCSYLTCALLFLSVLVLYYYFIKKQTIKHRPSAKLPPGSMGWPCIGETLQLYSQDPNYFFAKRQKRYGDILKTHILGCPCIMLASPEAARFVLVTHAHLFKPTYPRSKEKLIGPSALFFHQGDYHTHLRKLVQSSLSPEAIRKLIPDIQRIAVSTIRSWSTGQIVNTYHEMKKVVTWPSANNLDHFFLAFSNPHDIGMLFQLSVSYLAYLSYVSQLALFCWRHIRYIITWGLSEFVCASGICHPHF